MYTFIEEEQILVTCDSFGSHYCLPEVVSTEIKNEEDYQKALKYYYDCIIGPFKPFMLKALDRVRIWISQWCAQAMVRCSSATGSKRS